MKGATNAEAYKLSHPGTVSSDLGNIGYTYAHRPEVEAEMERLRRAAEKKAHAEYDIFNKTQLINSDFDKLVQRTRQS